MRPRPVTFCFNVLSIFTAVYFKVLMFSTYGYLLGIFFHQKLSDENTADQEAKNNGQRDSDHSGN